MLKRIMMMIITIVLYASVVSAFVPFVIPAIYYTGAAIATGVVGAYAVIKSGFPAQVGSSGLVSQPTKMAYYLLKGSAVELTEKDVTAKMSFSELQALAAKNGSGGTPLYPAVKSALWTTEYPPISKNSVVGSNYSTQYGNKSITSVFVGNSCQSNRPTYISTTSYEFYHTVSVFPGDGGCSEGMTTKYTRVTFPLTNIAAGPNRARTLPEVLSVISDGESGGDLKSAYQAELDKMFQDPDYVPDFSDDNTGLPLVYPPDIMTPAELSAYNAKQKLAEAQQTQQASADAAAASAGASAAHARDRYTATGGNADTGVGGDPYLYQEYLKEKARADEAEAEAEKVRTGQAQAEAETADEESIEVPSLPAASEYSTAITLPDMKSITGLLSGFFTNSPLAGLVRTFTITTSDADPVVSFGHVYGRDITIDFTRWQVWLSACGTIFLVIAHGFAVMIVIRGW